MTNCDFTRGDEPLPEASVEALRQWLDVQRFGIVAAHHVVAWYPALDDSSGSHQEELLFELRDPPEVAAPDALFLAVAREMPPLFPPIDIAALPRAMRSVTFSFVPGKLVERVREAGGLLWARDPARPWTELATVELVYERPELPAGLVGALQAVAEARPEVECVYVARERLLQDGRELSSRLSLHAEAELQSQEAARELTASLRSLLSEYFDSFGISMWPDPDARRDGLVVFEREVPR